MKTLTDPNIQWSDALKLINKMALLPEIEHLLIRLVSNKGGEVIVYNNLRKEAQQILTKLQY